MAASQNLPNRVHARDPRTRRALHAAKIGIMRVESRFHDSFKYGARSLSWLMKLLHAFVRAPQCLSCPDAGLVPVTSVR